jgi:hypothetical protein
MGHSPAISLWDAFFWHVQVRVRLGYRLACDISYALSHSFVVDAAILNLKGILERPGKQFLQIYFSNLLYTFKRLLGLKNGL